MSVQGELLDQREVVANAYLAASVWAEVRGDVQGAEYFAGRANHVDGEIRRSCGL